MTATKLQPAALVTTDYRRWCVFIDGHGYGPYTLEYAEVVCEQYRRRDDASCQT